MIFINKKVRTNKLKNKTKTASYKKQIYASSEQIELESVIFQYTLDVKQAAYSHAFRNCIQDLQNNLTKLLKSLFKIFSLRYNDSFHKTFGGSYDPLLSKR
ncbi:hypothetical protein, partial [Candidatus Rhabdochlamydia sp. W815]